MEKWIVRGGRSIPYMERFHLHPLVARILAGRIPLEQTADFLNKSKPFFDPWLMADMKKAVDLLQYHLEKGSSITIVGDYDVDGLTSTAILYRGLKPLLKSGGNLNYRIPERIGEGYGFSLSIAKELVQQSVELVITCDNGIREMESAGYLQEQGIDFIVTDHHEIQQTIEGADILPPASAVINPHRQSDQSPQKLICGAAVAFQVIRALYSLYEKTPPSELIGYAALGTICDVMPLVEENRRLVTQGLEQMNHQPTPGIAALMEAGSIDTVDTYAAGYVIGPMLNAGGRLGSQNHFMEVLLSEDHECCQTLAKELFDLNRERQNLTEDGIRQGDEQVEDSLKNDKVLVVYLPTVHESIAGLVAGKIKEKYHKPTFVITKAEHGLKGSGRSISVYHMFHEMANVAERYPQLYSKYGGHAAAAGFSLVAEPGQEEEVVQLFRKALNEQVTLTEEEMAKRVYIDATMPLSRVTLELMQQIEDLGPFGTGNPRPLLAQKDLKLRRCRFLGAKRNALKLLLEYDHEAVEAVCFTVSMVERIMEGDAKQMQEFYDGKYFSKPIAVDVVYQPQIDTYMGRVKVKWQIKHIRRSER